MNLSNLNNITPYTVNNTLINETENIVPNLITNTNTLTDGYFGLGIMVVLFLFLLIILMADQEVFRLKFSNAFVASSGITLLVGIIMLVSNLITSFSHVLWFAILFAISLVIVFYDKN
tara:strand:+ start:1666 stop:2019 length:354 start_codon:yes stop_codon:yes gene_type:complete